MPARHHPDDRVRLVVESYRLADDVAARTEPLPPDAVAEHSHARRAWPFIAGRQAASKRRLDVEHVEEIRVDDRAGEALGAVTAGECERGLPERGQPRETARADAPVEEVGRRGVEVVLSGLRVRRR